MNYVLDTNVVVAGIRSPGGASAEILRRVLKRSVQAVCSVPLFLEYEAVLLRPEQLAAAEINDRDVFNFLDVFASVILPIEIQFLWRPQLRYGARACSKRDGTRQ
jgi:predicted nucleic acid-binding protein